MVSGLKNDSPAKQLIELWDHDLESLKFWRASSNFVYAFDRNGERQFLRFIHEEDNTLENIQAELHFMQYLKENGYPTVSAVRSKKANLVETVRTDTGHYYGVVFKQARGKNIPLEKLSDRHFYNWGKALASLHRLSETYTPGTSSRKSCSDALNFIRRGSPTRG